VQLPQTVKPGYVFECLEIGGSFLLRRQSTEPKVKKPNIAKEPLCAPALDAIDLDEPAFTPPLTGLANETAS
jgi:hypothetical protein